MICRHGHFAFYPRDAADIARFATYNQIDLVRVSDYWTFEKIALAKEYSLEGLAYLNLIATQTYEGNPWEVFKQNNFVYDLANSKIILKTAVKNTVTMPYTGYYFSPGVFLVQPGSVLGISNRVMSYDAEFDRDTYTLRVREYGYE